MISFDICKIDSKANKNFWLLFWIHVSRDHVSRDYYLVSVLVTKSRKLPKSFCTKITIERTARWNFFAPRPTDVLEFDCKH